jgi:hypothetical protein
MTKKRQSKKNNKSSHSKHAQTFSIAVFIVVSGLLLFTSSNEPTGYVSAIQPISFEQAGTSFEFEVRNVDGLKEITASFSDTIKNAKITFDEVEKNDFPGIIYSTIKVASSDEDKISEMDLILRLEKEKLSELNLNKADVILYINNQESKLTYSHEDTFAYYFTGKAWEMGEWVIGMKFQKVIPPQAPEETTVVPTPTIPEPIIKQPKIEQPKPVKKESFLSRFFNNFFG